MWGNLATTTSNTFSTMINQEYARKIIRESAEASGEGIGARDYAKYSLENDPTFAAWLLNADNVGDYGLGATPEQEAEISEFIKSL